MPRETESNVQTRNSSPIHQGVAIGRKKKSNNLLISDSTVSPTTKLARMSSACREFQKQVQKLVNTKEILKDDSPEDNILSEKAAKKIHEASNCE